MDLEPTRNSPSDGVGISLASDSVPLSDLDGYGLGPNRSAGAGAVATTLKRTTGFLLTVLASLAIGIGLWYLVVLAFDMKPYVLPYPHVVAGAIWRDRADLASNQLVTLKEVLAGFAVATVVGIVIGIVLTFSRLMLRLLYPLIVFAQAAPKVALAPLFLAWFGYAFTANLAITILIAVFPVVINTMLGLSTIDLRMVQLGRSMGASTWRLFWRIRLPIALPTMLAGVKLAMTFAVIGAVIGEFVAGSAGLGWMIQDAGGRLETDRSIAAIVVVSVMAVILYFVVELAERLMVGRGRLATSGRQR